MIYFSLIYHGYFFNKKLYRPTTDIFRTWVHSLLVNVTFYDAVNMIHDFITTANPFQYTANFIFSVLEIIKINKSDIERLIEYVYSVVVYQKYLNRLGELIILSSRFENYQFSQISLDIFDIRQQYRCICYINQHGVLTKARWDKSPTYLNSVSNDRVLDLSILKIFSDQILVEALLLEVILDRIINNALFTSIFSFSN